MDASPRYHAHVIAAKHAHKIEELFGYQKLLWVLYKMHAYLCKLHKSTCPMLRGTYQNQWEVPRIT